MSSIIPVVDKPIASSDKVVKTPELPLDSNWRSTITPGAPVTFNVTGTIDAKIDNGYLVSVKLGSETLYGVIYQQDHPNPSESARSSNSVVPYDPNDMCKRRKRKREKDPDRPKPNRSAYSFYFSDKHCELKSRCPEKEREFFKMIGVSWKNLCLQEKNVYNEIAKKDKERYQTELREYEEKTKDQDEGNETIGQ